jgi:transposase
MMMERIGPHGLEIIGVRRDGRRRYDPVSKERLIEACLRPGVSLAGVALQHGVNANLLRKWVVRHRQAGVPGLAPVAAQLPDPAAFVRVETAALPAAAGGGVGAIAVERAKPMMSSARLQARMPNGVTLSLEGCDPQLVAAMIGALGHCDVPPVG